MATMTKPPAGWDIELLGLAHAVQFTNDGRRLLWSDGRWFRESRRPDGQWLAMPAQGVPSADTMKDARRVGCEFLHEFEHEAGSSSLAFLAYTLLALVPVSLVAVFVARLAGAVAGVA